jgi:glutamate 5-kinase
LIAFQDLLYGRVVIKYGTNALTKIDEQGKILGIDKSKILGIAKVTKILFVNGVEPIIVSSGAVIAAMEQKRLNKRPSDKKELQDLATDGQIYLFSSYSDAFEKYGLGMRGPLLVNYYNFRTAKERKNLLEIVERGFVEKRIPVFNTNDTVTNAELVPRSSKYGFTDNDPLAALVSIYCNANTLLIVSEPGDLGSGGSDSKVKALQKAESYDVKTNLGIKLTHEKREEMIMKKFS